MRGVVRPRSPSPIGAVADDQRGSSPATKRVAVEANASESGQSDVQTGDGEPQQQPSRRVLRSDEATRRSAAALTIQCVVRSYVARQQLAARQRCRRECIQGFRTKAEKNFYAGEPSRRGTRAMMCFAGCDACKTVRKSSLSFAGSSLGSRLVITAGSSC